MGFESVISAVAPSVIGGLMEEDASGPAAQTLNAGANQGAATSAAQYRQTRNDLRPYMNQGQAANNRLALLLGLPSSGGFGSGADAPESFAQFSSRYDQPGSRDWTSLEYSNIDSAYNDYLNNRPQNKTQQSDPEFGALLKKYTGQDLQSEPGYQFRQQQGQRGVESSAAARGGLFSGAAAKALDRYNQDYASNEYQNAFNRDAAQKNQLYSMLSGQQTIGQNSATQTGTFGANAAGQVAGYQTDAASADAAGMIGAANANNNRMNSALNAFQNYNLMNQIGKVPNTWGTNPAQGTSLGGMFGGTGGIDSWSF